jgi:hypothetical protein
VEILSTLSNEKIVNSNGLNLSVKFFSSDKRYSYCIVIIHVILIALL